MDSTPTTGPPAGGAEANRAFEQQLREMNEALLVSSVHQHELAQQAQQAELRYRRLFETAKDGILILDTHTGRITDANPFLSKLLGYSIGEFLGKELWEVGLFSDKLATEAAVRELQEKGYVHYENLPLENNQGRQVEVEVVANAYTEDHQGASQYNIRDITERRKTERALDKALAYGDDIIATLREPFLVLDHDLRVRTANRSFYDAFHVSKEETENRFVYDLGNGQWDIPGLRTLLDQVLSRNQSVRDFEVEHSFPTLGRKTMLLNARPFPPDSKHPELILLAVYDVSAARARADGLAEANRHKDEFLAMLSHELRSPLSPILNAVQLLRLQRDGTPLQKEAHGIIERQVAQLARLVDDLLEVSRISTGRIHLQEERVDLRGIVDRAIETTQPQAGQKGQSVAKSLPDQPLWIYGDAMRLEQVVVNLLNNASKYTGRGGHIWVGLKHEGDQAELRVRDNGMGIAPELLPHIFDLFTQADKSLDRSQGGLGIGLALVRSLVTMHRGQVEAHSTVGQGSEFVVKLPVLSASPESTAIPVPIVASPHRPLKVLAVDDNVDAAKGVAMLLRAFGHEARVAHDGASAMQAALEYVPDVVLLDIGLPITNGYEVAKWIRQEPGLKDVVLVAVTGYGQESDLQRSREAGFDHHLVKPVDFAKIENILSAVAERVL